MSVRVAFLQASMNIGGAERLVQALATRMDRARVEPVIVNLYEPGPVGEEVIAAGVPDVSRLARSRTDVGVGGRLRAALVREAIDVVYVIDSPMPLFWAGLGRRRSPGPRLVMGMHSTGRIADPLQHAIAERVGFPAVDRFVALAETHRAWMCSRYRLDPSRVDVIVSGVDLAAFAPVTDRDAVRAELGLPAGVPMAGIIAALRPEKNHALFVEVAARVHARLPDARFVVAGDGPGRAALEAAVAARGLAGSFHVLGARRDVPRLWRALDVAVLTSHPLVETLPVTLLESHACGLPAVSTDVGSVRDVIAEGETGYLAAPGDAETLAARLTALLSDPALRGRLGAAARARAERRFDRDVMVRAYEDLFVRLGEGAAGRR